MLDKFRYQTCPTVCLMGNQHPSTCEGTCEKSVSECAIRRWILTEQDLGNDKARGRTDFKRSTTNSAQRIPIQSSFMVTVQRPGLSPVGFQVKLEARGPLIGVMIWSDLTGDCERLSETGNRNKVQNIPRPSSDEFKIRKAFIASPGMKFLSADYSQLEMYLMGSYSKDEGMLKNIREGLDIHAGNAALVWDIPYKEIIDAIKAKDSKATLTSRQLQLLEYRQFAKVVGFGQPNLGRSKTCSKRGNLSVN